MGKRPDQGVYSVWSLPQFGRNGRGLAFLTNSKDRHCDAETFYKALDQKGQRPIHTRFEAWLDHHDDQITWFHGFPNHAKYKGCFTFKWRVRGSGQRFYGFLHGANELQQGFQICILVLHAIKNEGATDTAELDRVVDRRNALEVRRAVRNEVLILKEKGWPTA